MSDSTLSQANEAALLNVLMYINIEDVGVEDGWTLSQIISKLKPIYDSPDGYNKYLNRYTNGSETDYAEIQRQYKILANACERSEHFANLVIGNQSRLMTDPSYQAGGLEACTFTDTATGDVTVVYRGTGAGEWIDNGKGLSGLGVETPQQIEAAEYFKRIVEDNGYDDDNINITISGHSKGGNKAQYVTITSEYNYLINNCFNFDGQGFSPEAIEEFISKYGKEAYLQAVNKMFGFYADNDYVNPLGIPVVPEENRTYFESQIVDGIGDIAKYHYADDYLDINGYFSAQTEQGELSKFIQTLSENIMSLPPELRAKATAAAMGICQKFLGGGVPVNCDSVSWKDYLLGIPIIVDVLSEGLIETIKDKYGSGVELLAVIFLAANFPILFIDELFEVVITDLKAVVGATLEMLGNVVNAIVDGLKKIGNELLEFAKDLGKVLCKFASEIKKAWDSATSFIGGLAEGALNIGKALVDTVVDIGSAVADTVVDIGSAVVDTVIDAGGAVVDFVVDAGGAVVDAVVGIGEAAVDAGTVIAEAAVDAGAAIADWLSDFKDKAINVISSFFTGVTDGVKNIITSIGKVASDTWNKITQNSGKVINSAKEQIEKQYEAYKEGSIYIASIENGTINDLGEKSVFRSPNNSIVTGILKGCMTGKLIVDLTRLSNLKEKMRNLNSYFEESVAQIIREADKVIYDVGRSYGESYVQQQISRANNICIQIEQSNKRIYDALQRKDTGLKHALDQYSQKEAFLCQLVNG